MKLVAFDLPEQTHELSDWLATQITGPNLSSIVAQLSAVHADQNDELTIDAVCREQWTRVLQNGMSELTQAQLQQLLTHPNLLMELQERLLLEGEEYWQNQFLNQSDDSQINQTKLVIQESLAQPTVVSEPAQPVEDYKKNSYRKIATLGFLSAALVFFAVFLNQGPEPTPGWGWNRPGALTADVPADQYLNGLADSANEWFKKPTETKGALITRLTQFRNGCETLINAPHPQLSNKDRTWLIKRCQVWADKLDAQIVDLQNGADVKSADANADALIHKLVKALQTRAGQVA